ncbi:hypothetical protein [Nonomuraea mesophila]|uniref:hypothetical protein n=1 Tax=Nonomuraea mesophila TaxID=2530382 RepID=UPI001408D10E|nr:hypothetical protein [Nonomuraea mesophila]
MRAQHVGERFAPLARVERVPVSRMNAVRRRNVRSTTSRSKCSPRVTDPLHVLSF